MGGGASSAGTATVYVTGSAAREVEEDVEEDVEADESTRLGPDEEEDEDDEEETGAPGVGAPGVGCVTVCACSARAYETNCSATISGRVSYSSRAARSGGKASISSASAKSYRVGKISPPLPPPFFAVETARAAVTVARNCESHKYRARFANSTESVGFSATIFGSLNNSACSNSSRVVSDSAASAQKRRSVSTLRAPAMGQMAERE